MPDFSAIPASDERFVWLSGELDMWSVGEFAAAMGNAVRAGGAVVVDLTRLTFIDSDGIRALLSVTRQLNGRGCLILHNPTPHVAKVLQIVGLPSVPDVHLLDEQHAEMALPDGPGAWSRAAAFQHVLVDTAVRMTRAGAIVQHAIDLCGRTDTLVGEMRRLRAAYRSSARSPAVVST